MSGLDLKGAQPTASIVNKKIKHDHPNKKAKKEAAVGISTPVTLGKPFKVGILIRQSQVATAVLKITKPPRIVLTKEPPSANPPPGSVQAQLNQAFPPRTGTGNPDLDEQWVAFTGTLPRPTNPAQPDVPTFAVETDLDIATTPIPAHGFQTWAVVLGYKDTDFGQDHYLVATSVLTGEDMRAVQIKMNRTPKPKPAPRPPPQAAARRAKPKGKKKR